MMETIISKLINLPGILIALSFHEYAHAKMADMLGDPTPRSQGRVTLNPIAHLDLLGFVALLLVGFGWGKPVQIDGRHFKNFKRDEILVSAAGVTMNLFLALLFTGIIKLMQLSGLDFMGTTGGNIAVDMLWGVVWINVILMVFNLLPIPPLDGFNIVAELTHLRARGIYHQIYEKGPILLLILIFFNITDKIIGPAANFILTGIVSLFFS